MALLRSYKEELHRARTRVARCGSTVSVTRLGLIEYLAFGNGPLVVWVHGVLGGCDHGPSMTRAFIGDGFRFLAVSRFGYLRSPIPEIATPTAQADLFAALLDDLAINKAAVVGASAGGPSCLQFALRHPDRCSALVLWSSAVPGNQVPPAPLKDGLARYFGSDFLQWLTMSYAPWLTMTIMGVPRGVRSQMTSSEQSWASAVMWSFLPVQGRVAGVLNDVCVTNPDLNAHYPLEEITVPTMIVHAEDDPMPKFALAKETADRIPGANFVPVPSGGHLLIGHHEEVRHAIGGFLRAHGGSS